MKNSKRNPAGTQRTIQEEEHDNKLKARELAEKFKNIKPTKFDLK